MCLDHVFDNSLVMEHSALLERVEIACGIDALVEVLLGLHAQVEVLELDLLQEINKLLLLIIGQALLGVDVVLEDGSGRGDWQDSDGVESRRIAVHAVGWEQIAPQTVERSSRVLFGLFRLRRGLLLAEPKPRRLRVRVSFLGSLLDLLVHDPRIVSAIVALWNHLIGLHFERNTQARVCSWTMVALLVAVHERFPVELAVQLVRHVVLIVVEVVLVHFFLESGKELLERSEVLGVVKVDKHEALFGGVGFDLKQRVGLWIEPFHLVEVRSLGQHAVCVVRPAVVFATKDDRRAFFFSHNRISSVSANVVERLDLAGLGLDQEKVPPKERVREVVAGLFEALLVGHKQPRLGKDGFFLIIKHFLGRPPGGRQSVLARKKFLGSSVFRRRSRLGNSSTHWMMAIVYAKQVSFIEQRKMHPHRELK